MKSILIPTVLENDTLYAIDMAMKHSKKKCCNIVLLILAEAPDACSATEFLRKTRKPLTAAQSELLDECHNKVALSAHCTLEVHYQYGISGPLLRNLLEYFGTEMIILSPSYKAEKKKIHTYFCKLAGACKKPILHLGSGREQPGFNKALYIERDNTQIGIQELQQLVNAQFDLKIVSQANIAGAKDDDSLTPFLNEAIAKNGIDLLIETRKPQKAMLASKSGVSEAYGLPVLSIHEEASRV